MPQAEHKSFHHVDKNLPVRAHIMSVIKTNPQWCLTALGFFSIPILKPDSNLERSGDKILGSKLNRIKFSIRCCYIIATLLDRHDQSSRNLSAPMPSHERTTSQRLQLQVIRSTILQAHFWHKPAYWTGASVYDQINHPRQIQHDSWNHQPKIDLINTWVGYEAPLSIDILHWGLSLSYV